MQWIVLLMLIACGHQEPPAKDLQDSDGDLIANEYEAGAQRYFAQYQEFAPLDGSLFISSESDPERTEIKFSNQRDWPENILSYLATGSDVPAYFSETAALHLAGSMTARLPRGEILQVKLRFQSTQDQISYLSFVTRNTRQILGKWSSIMELSLSADQLKRLLAGEAQLELGRSAEELLKSQMLNRSYRVFHADGDETKLTYVSREFSFQKFLEHGSYTKTFDLSALNLTQIDDEEEGWWFRRLSSGDHVLYFGKASSVKEKYLQGLPHEKGYLGRTNGLNQRVITLQGKSLGTRRVFLKIEPKEFMVRSFADRKGQRSGGGGREGNGWECSYTERFVASEISHPIDGNLILSQLRVFSEGAEVKLADTLRHFQKKGGIWELGLEFTGTGKVEVKLLDQPASSYNVIGITHSTCAKNVIRGNSVPTHPEGSFLLKVDAYLEW